MGLPSTRGCGRGRGPGSAALARWGCLGCLLAVTMATLALARPSSLVQDTTLEPEGECRHSGRWGFVRGRGPGAEAGPEPPSVPASEAGASVPLASGLREVKDEAGEESEGQGAISSPQVRGQGRRHRPAAAQRRGLCSGEDWGVCAVRVAGAHLPPAPRRAGPGRGPPACRTQSSRPGLLAGSLAPTCSGRRWSCGWWTVPASETLTLCFHCLRAEAALSAAAGLAVVGFLSRGRSPRGRSWHSAPSRWV